MTLAPLAEFSLRFSLILKSWQRLWLVTFCTPMHYMYGRFMGRALGSSIPCKRALLLLALPRKISVISVSLYITRNTYTTLGSKQADGFLGCTPGGEKW